MYICNGKFHSLPIFFIAIFLTHTLGEVSFFIDFPKLFYSIFVALKIKYMFLNISITEWIGYLASLALIISFMMKNLNTLRIINSIGAVLFVVYGFMLAISWPIIITNTFILLANIYYLTFKRIKN